MIYLNVPDIMTYIFFITFLNLFLSSFISPHFISPFPSSCLILRSFKFDAWCKKFVGWIDQNKLRVSDLFRRFDSNHDGMLTREEFMKGLKASGKKRKER